MTMEPGPDRGQYAIALKESRFLPAPGQIGETTDDALRPDSEFRRRSEHARSAANHGDDLGLSREFSRLSSDQRRALSARLRDRRPADARGHAGRDVEPRHAVGGAVTGTERAKPQASFAIKRRIEARLRVRVSAVSHRRGPPRLAKKFLRRYVQLQFAWVRIDGSRGQPTESSPTQQEIRSMQRKKVSRREFVQTTAAAGVGFWVAGSALATKPSQIAERASAVRLHRRRRQGRQRQQRRPSHSATSSPSATSTTTRSTRKPPASRASRSSTTSARCSTKWARASTPSPSAFPTTTMPPPRCSTCGPASIASVRSR